MLFIVKCGTVTFLEAVKNYVGRFVNEQKTLYMNQTYATC